VLVRPGTYAGFAVPNRDLRIVADGTALISINGAIRIRNLAAGKTTVIDGFSATGVVATASAERYGLYISNCAGAVRIQNCSFQSRTTQLGTCDATPAVGVLNSTNVVLSGVVATTPPSNEYSSTPLYAAAGLRVETSTVAAFGCTLSGGPGGRYTCWQGCTDIPGWESGCGNYTANCDGSYGGPGMDVLSGTVHLDGCTLVGGASGSGTVCAGICGSCRYSGDGGDGVRIRNGAVVTALDCTWSPGASSGNLDSTPGDPQRLLGTAAVYTAHVGVSRRMSVANPLREGSHALLSFTGTQGDWVSLAMTRGSQLSYSPVYGSTVVFGTTLPPRMLIVGTVPASGQLQYTMAIPQVVPMSRTMCFQPFVRDSAGLFHVGTPALITVLEAGL